MAEEVSYVDISQNPDLVCLAEEVRATQKPRVLRRDGEDVALLLPVRPARPPRMKLRKRPADYEAFRQAAGSWQDVDTDKLLGNIHESRRRSLSPPVAL